MKKFFHNIGSIGWGLVHTIPKIVRQPSLWPDRPRKSAFRRYVENAYFRFVRHGICLGYNGIGLDLRGVPVRDVLVNADRKPMFEFWVRKQKQDWLAVVEDKYLLHLYLKAHSLPVVPVLAHTIGTTAYIGDSETTLSGLQDWLVNTQKSFFMKATADLCGQNVYKMSVIDRKILFGGREIDIADVVKTGNGGMFLFQPVVVNHAELRRINGSTLNTLRLNTCWNKDGEVELWDNGFIRVGHAGSFIDNFAAGGIAVGIKDGDGRLRDYGINHNSNYNYRLYPKHPDSGVVFAGFKVPLYREAVELCKCAQRLFPTIPSIGWDVCVMDDGLQLLEANWNWGIEEIEMINGYHAMNRWKEIYGNWRCK